MVSATFADEHNLAERNSLRHRPIRAQQLCLLAQDVLHDEPEFRQDMD